LIADGIESVVDVFSSSLVLVGLIEVRRTFQLMKIIPTYGKRAANPHFGSRFLGDFGATIGLAGYK